MLEPSQAPTLNPASVLYYLPSQPRHRLAGVGSHSGPGRYPHHVPAHAAAAAAAAVAWERATGSEAAAGVVGAPYHSPSAMGAGSARAKRSSI